MINEPCTVVYFISNMSSKKSFDLLYNHYIVEQTTENIQETESRVKLVFNPEARNPTQ